MDLATIRSSDDHEKIQAIADAGAGGFHADNNGYWIGLNDKPQENAWPGRRVGHRDDLG